MKKKMERTCEKDILHIMQGLQCRLKYTERISREEDTCTHLNFSAVDQFDRLLQRLCGERRFRKGDKT